MTTPTTPGESAASVEGLMKLVMDFGRSEYHRGRGPRPPSDHEPELDAVYRYALRLFQPCGAVPSNQDAFRPVWTAARRIEEAARDDMFFASLWHERFERGEANFRKAEGEAEYASWFATPPSASGGAESTRDASLTWLASVRDEFRAMADDAARVLREHVASVGAGESFSGPIKGGPLRVRVDRGELTPPNAPPYGVQEGS